VSALARSLLHRVRAAPGPPAADRLQRVDSILERLRSGQPAELRAAVIAGSGEEEDLATLIEAVDSALARPVPDAAEPRLIGAIEVLGLGSSRPRQVDPGQGSH
ncbi:MAG: hypothetical protein ACRELV_08880, partial [Longimicrobiales bacterium]